MSGDPPNSAAIPLPADCPKLSQGVDKHEILDVQEAIFGLKPNFSLLAGKSVAAETAQSGAELAPSRRIRPNPGAPRK
jgi:hypothetical protein